MRDVLQTIISVHVILERLGMQSLRPHRTFNMVLCHTVGLTSVMPTILRSFIGAGAFLRSESDEALGLISDESSIRG